MTDSNLEVMKLKQDGDLERERIKADVRKVVYGTFLLGVAVALFPVISGAIEHYFNLRIEQARQVNALALQANQLALDLQKVQKENDLAIEAAKSATEQSDRTFFEAISDETRSARLSDRITIAEFYGYVARDKLERDRWLAFLGHLNELQEKNNALVPDLKRVVEDGSRSAAEREAAARQLAQIEQRESGTAPAVAAVSKWQDMVPIPDATPAEGGDLHRITNEAAIALLGNPLPGGVQGSPTACQTLDNPRLSDLMTTRSLGPFSTTLIRPAMDSLETVLAAVKEAQPDLYAEITPLGGLCVRLVGGAAGRLSTHSWGIAIDLTIGGKFFGPRKGVAPAGLVELSRYFAKEGWIWGGRWSFPDTQHFEVSAEKLAEWNTAGKFAP